MSQAAISLGPFRLFHPIGRGGMGTVWSGEHRSGEPVAVKVLTAQGRDTENFRRLFENEVRAVASLRHANIVVVHDYGEVGHDAFLDGTRVARGSPYLVMELATGGSLQDVQWSLDWHRLRQVLHELLTGLAHAHARGVVHRDIKAANVLIDADSSRAILTDFGLARLADEGLAADEPSNKSGTPSHMAPEQFAGAWRDFGAWTDLYGLGVVTWSIVTGHPPYGRKRGWREAGRLHLEAPLPTLVPRFDVPAGLEGWLHRMLAKDPGARFGRAADARGELERLGRSLVRARPPASVVDPDGETISLTSEEGFEAPPAIGCPAPPPVPAVLIDDWRTLDPPRPGPATMAGVGLGLVGLRPVPLVDREEARDLLWASAREVLQTGSPRAVVLRGTAGCGKSRLARWICEALEAEGVGLALSAVHGPTGGPLDGLGPMVSRWVRDQGLSPDVGRLRAQQMLRRLGASESEDAHALVAVAHPDAEGATVRLGSPRERHHVVRQWLGRLAGSGRMVVLWLDDVQWGLDAVSLAGHVLASAHLPVLVVATVREDAEASDAAALSLLHVLCERESVRTAEIGPLEPDDRAELVRRLLGLEGELAREVERRTGGNPLFAVQLVGDWVARGTLVPTQGGFELRFGTRAAVPDDVHALWMAQLDRVLVGRHPDDLAALELAALLGQEVQGDEWRAVCEAAEVRPTERLVPTLVRQRLARSDDPVHSWSFVHGMLRESVERTIRDAGRWSRRHQQVAAALQARGARPGRIGRHQFEAGLLEEAVEPLLDGARAALRAGARRERAELVALAQRALDGLRAPPNEPRRLTIMIHEAEASSLAGQIDAGKRQAQLAAGLAEDAGLRELQAFALLADGQGSILRREVDQAREILHRALALVVDGSAPVVEARVRTGLATLAYSKGLAGEVEEHLTHARRVFEEAGDQDGIGRCLTIHAVSMVQQRDAAGACAVFERALEAYQRAGARLGQAVAFNGLAMAVCDLGDPERGLTLMRRAVALAEATGSDAAVTALSDLGTILIQLGRIDEALVELRSSSQGLLAAGQRVRHALCHARMLHPLAIQQDRAGLLESLGVAEQLLELQVYTRREAIHCTEAGRVSTALAWTDEARRAWLVARHLWAGLQRVDRVQECDEGLACL